MKIKYLLIVFSFFVSCNNKSNKIEEDFLLNSINNLDLDSNYEWIVVLPGLGCHGCIDVAEAFVKEYIVREDILFVLTKIDSLKILQQKLDIDINDYSNIYIDKEGLFDIPTDNTIYPYIIKLENRKLITYEFQSPKNSTAFNILKRKLINENQ